MAGTAAEVVRDEAVRRVYLGQGFGAPLEALAAPDPEAPAAGVRVLPGRRAP